MSTVAVAAPWRGLVRVGGVAAIVAGALRITSTFIPYQADSASLEALYGAIDVAFLFGLVAIHLVTAEATGVVGLCGFLIALAGLASIVGPDASAFGIDFYRVGALVFVGGLALMAAAMLFAGVMRVVAGLWVLTLAASLATIVWPTAFIVSGVCIGVGFVVAGIGALSLRLRRLRETPA